METPLSFKSDSSVWNKPLSDVVFTLHDKDCLVNIGNDTNHTFFYSDIEKIRMNYTEGGKHTPNKYCCILYLNNKKQYAIKVADAQTNQTRILEYMQFVEALFDKMKVAQPQTKLHIGHALATYIFMQLVLFFTILIFLAALIYFTVIAPEEMKVPVTLYLIPAVAIVFLVIQMFAMRKQKPYTQHISAPIPHRVLPKKS